MDFESYLNEEEMPMLALKNLTEQLEETIETNFEEILNGASRSLMRDIYSIIWAINLVNNSMLTERNNIYKEFIKNF